MSFWVSMGVCILVAVGAFLIGFVIGLVTAGFITAGHEPPENKRNR